MSAPELPTPEPVVALEAKPFWDAAAQGRLVLQRCAGCLLVVWYPRALCPACSGTQLDWFEASGRGTIYSYTVNHRGDGAYKGAAPYILAYVELDEGPRVLTNVVECDPVAVNVGQPVRAVFQRTAGGLALLRFRPA